MEVHDDKAATIQMIISFNKRGETMAESRFSGRLIGSPAMAGATPVETFTAL